MIKIITISVVWLKSTPKLISINEITIFAEKNPKIMLLKRKTVDNAKLNEIDKNIDNIKISQLKIYI